MSVAHTQSTQFYLNNCLLEHVGVYGTVASCSLTQSPKRTECSLGVLAISTGSCITKKTEQRGQDSAGELIRQLEIGSCNRGRGTFKELQTIEIFCV